MIKVFPQLQPYTLFALLLATLVMILSCQSENDQRKQLAPVNPSTSTEIVRFEQLISQLPTDQLLQEFDNLNNLYPAFSQLYANQLLKANTKDLLVKELKLAQEDSSYIQLYKEVQEVFGDLSDFEPQLNQALENYLRYFELPLDQLPVVYTFISGFAYQAFVFNDKEKNGIGVGLDMFLGSDFPYQKIHPADPSFSQYLIRTYNREHIVRKIVEVLVEDQLIPPAKSNFLSIMMWGGKKLYMIDQIMNFAPDTIITEYSKDQLNWCQNNEEEMWNFFFTNDLFYDTDIRNFNQLVAPAPTSPGMPKESPGQTGNYMGWQIIKSFIKRYPKTSARELVALQDAQHILDLSKYKPRRNQ